jgi:hypothetical protein
VSVDMSARSRVLWCSLRRLFLQGYCAPPIGSTAGTQMTATSSVAASMMHAFAHGLLKIQGADPSLSSTAPSAMRSSLWAPPPQLDVCVPLSTELVFHAAGSSSPEAYQLNQVCHLQLSA